MALHGHKARRVTLIGAGPGRTTAAVARCSRVPDDTPALRMTMPGEYHASFRRMSVRQKELRFG